MKYADIIVNEIAVETCSKDVLQEVKIDYALDESGQNDSKGDQSNNSDSEMASIPDVSKSNLNIEHLH